MNHSPNPYGLIDAADSVLIVIDVQDAFLQKLAKAEADHLLNKICWLVDLAQWRQVPLVVTAEERAEMPVAAQLLQSLPDQTPIFDKETFGLAKQPDILAAVAASKRKTAIIIGLETDVCVLHSALGLLEVGYRVAVVIDAVGTPARHQTVALKRLQSAGIILLDVKGLFYEWLPTVEIVNQFHRKLPEMRGRLGEVL